MADFSSSKRTASLEEWREQLELIVELNCKRFDITEAEITAGYEAYKRVDDFFYDEWGDEYD